jgi:hypothetical protein
MSSRRLFVGLFFGVFSLYGCTTAHQQAYQQFAAQCQWPVRLISGVYRCLPPVSLTVNIRNGMTLGEVQSILGSPSSRVSESLLMWDMSDPNFSLITSPFFVGFDKGGRVNYMGRGGGSTTPSIDVNIYRR